MVRSFGSQPTYVDQGLYIIAKDGPAFPGDEQHISPRYTYGVNNSFPRTAASPRKPWWYASGDKLAVQLNSETSSAPPWLSEVLGFALVNAPGTEIDIDAYNGTAWVNHGNLSTVETLGSTTRAGDTFEASAGSAITFDSNELLGAWFYLESGANWILGPIIANSEGDWANGTDLRARVVIDLASATDSGAPPTSGTGYIFHPSATFITHHNGVNYSAFRFTPTHRCLGTPPDDIAKIGSLFLGPVMVFGQEYSWGRVIETQANVELSEGGDWTRWTRSRSAPRRIVDFAWQDGVDSSNDDFIKGTTDVASLGVATMGGTPVALEGLLRLANGPETPVAYTRSPSEVINEIRLEYARQASTGDAKRYTVLTGDPEPEDPSQWTNQAARISLARYGVGSKTIETDVVYDDATAHLICQWQLAVYGSIPREVTYEASREWGWLEPGQVVTLTDSELYMSNQVALIESVSWSGGAVEIKVVVL